MINIEDDIAKTASFITGTSIEECKRIYERLKPILRLADAHYQELCKKLKDIYGDDLENKYSAIIQYHQELLMSHGDNTATDITIRILKHMSQRPELEKMIKKF